MEIYAGIKLFMQKTGKPGVAGLKKIMIRKNLSG
jgi:hypothetical protein